MKKPIRLTVVTLLLGASGLSAASHYVSLESTNPTPPYTNWVTAATNIQDAVDVAATNDVVLVTNGVYSGGVDVEKPLTLLSVNGPKVTIVNGGGNKSYRCVSLANGASLTGFALTSGIGSGSYGGGVWGDSANAFVTNCVIVGNEAWLGGGGASGCVLYNCTLTYNSGGGASGCTLYNCTVTGNSAYYGGGAHESTLY